MRRVGCAVAVMVLAAVLAGCADESDQGGVGASPSESTAAPTPDDGTNPLERTEIGVPDVAPSCEAVYGTTTLEGVDEPLADRIRLMLASYPFELDEEQAQAYADVDAELGAVAEDAPEAIAEQLQVVRRPFADVSRVLDDGGGNLVVDTTGVAQALDALEAICVAGGYDV